jgi:hypothetical protein
MLLARAGHLTEDFAARMGDMSAFRQFRQIADAIAGSEESD